MYILAYVVPFDVGIQDILSPAIFQIQVEVVLHSPDIDRIKREGPIRARFLPRCLRCNRSEWSVARGILAGLENVQVEGQLQL